MAIGEPYRLNSEVPAEYAAKNAAFHAEYELLEIVREEGYDLETVVRSDQDDWDRYKSGKWQGLIHWLEGEPRDMRSAQR